MLTSTRTHGSVWTAIMPLFVLLDSAELVLSSPLWKMDADIPYQRIMKYNVTITESGEWYNERIEVDEEKQTELIKVPATSKKHRSNILHDFKTNTSMFQLPDKKICLFMPFDQETPSPSQLIRSLDSEVAPTETVTINHKWIVDSVVTDRSVLSDEVENFCEKYPIYSVKKAQDFVLSANKKGKENGRQRRTPRLDHLQDLVDMSYPPIVKIPLCPSRKARLSVRDIVSCSTQRKSWTMKCKDPPKGIIMSLYDGMRYLTKILPSDTRFELCVLL